MSLFFLKSIMSVVLSLSAVLSMYTMFEIFGRKEPGRNPERMKSIHKMNGICYMVIFIIVSYFCLDFIYLTKSELSSRSTLHGILALAIFVLMGVKITYVRVYRQYYNQAKIIGLIMALLTFGTAGASGGYYLLVSEFGSDISFDKLAQYKKRLALSSAPEQDISKKTTVRTDQESIGRGKNLFDSKCSFCHDAYSTETIVGPGLKGILKKNKLPYSKLPATPETIIHQLKKPVNRMPSFDYLSDEEISDILAFLNSL